jgi:hypothetical protein
MSADNSVYQPFRCWWMHPGTHDKAISEHLCSLPAGKFMVRKLGGLTVVSMWLCAKHKKSMEKQGYTVTLE